ncbi:unnamed protein product [Soboliphyme baturini]|uniref:Laminin N-terminal domain-containing protein n=1 Tax=Soboliphyme baturini TaxID=241478 RepID=A0A183I994_9BILA|nr:unnamed protein product [Soboliphyme baturini]
MSEEATVMRALCMFVTCLSCAVAQLQTASTPLTGFDVRLSVLNISTRYTDVCPFDTYINYLCNSINVPIQHRNGETRHAMQILEVKYN